MAAEDAAEGEVEAFEGAVFAEGLEGVLGAGRGEAAAWGLERGDADLIEAYQEDEGRDGDLFDAAFDLALMFCHNFRYEDFGSSPERCVRH